MPYLPPREHCHQPWSWFLPYLVVFLMFTALVLVLVIRGESVAVAVGVPMVLSGVAVRALCRAASLMPARHTDFRA